jgi:RimJ/RimL family protein N-acetyltransferase
VGGRDRGQGGVGLEPGDGTASGVPETPSGRELTVRSTARLVLRPFDDTDRQPFFELNTHPLVVESLGVAATRAESDAMIERYTAELAREGWSFWAVAETGSPALIGMVGLHRIPPWLPCAPAVEIGWRLHPDTWGRGYATEAAGAALAAGFAAGIQEIVAYTTTRNARSQAVMRRIGMERDAAGDFDHPSLPEESPLRRHVLYRIRASHVRPPAG